MARIAENQTHDLPLTMPMDLTGKTLETVIGAMEIEAGYEEVMQVETALNGSL
jgi:hypothetical protein